MSTLVLVLTAAMAVPSNGPEMVSAEMEPPGLDLRGDWEGAWLLAEGLLYPATMDDRFISGCDPKVGAICHRVSDIIDEGNGKFRIEPKDQPGCWLGIYEQCGGHLCICFGEDGKDRPRIFRGGDGQHLLILHRVKPRK